MIVKQPFIINILSVDKITGDIVKEENNPESKPIILILHGFKAHKQWGFYPYICEYFAKAGAIAICCNVSLNGYDAESDTLIHPEKFAANTLTRELSDIHSIMDYILSNAVNTFADWNGSIYLIGHSRGGAMAVLTAKAFPIISKIVLWASISKFDRYSLRQKNKWKEQGYVSVEQSETDETLHINRTFIDDLEKHPDSLDILSAISQIQCAVYIIHGEQDMTVPLRDAEALASSAQVLGSTYFIPATGHTFGITHPFLGTTKALDTALNVSKGFLFS